MSNWYVNDKKKKKRKISIIMKIKQIILLAGILLGMQLHSQQDPMYTQYMFNMLSVNPAYTGSKDAISILGLHRTQWVGIEGAPTTQTLSIHGPVYGKNMGLGLSLVNDAIGKTHQTQVFIDYSYMIHLSGNSKLRFGLQGGFSVFQTNYNNSTIREGGDNSIFNYTGKLLPNIGVGLFYYGERGYLGLSMPKLLTNYVKGNNDVEVGRVRRHLFFEGGYVFDLNDKIKFKPSFMLRAVYGAPLSLDLSGMFYLYDHLGLGLAMRREDSFSGLINYYFDNGLFLGYAYDFTRTPLRNYSRGTHEFALGYDFGLLSKKKIRSPRFF